VKGEGCGGWTVDKAGSPGESCLVLRHVEDCLHSRLLSLCVHHSQAEPLQIHKRATPSNVITAIFPRIIITQVSDLVDVDESLILFANKNVTVQVKTRHNFTVT
jgi:hypothetical protein